MKKEKVLNIEFEVYYWDDENSLVYTDGGVFSYSEVIPNEDYTKVVIYYE